jgi:hypothetical protein
LCGFCFFLNHTVKFGAVPPAPRPRPYRLTAVGAAILTEQLHELSEFAQLGLRRLGRTPG